MLPRATPSGLARPVPPSPGTTASPIWYAALAIIIAALYLAREVLIPFVLSILLSFLLSPVLSRLRRWGLGRIPAVAITVVLAMGVVGAISWFFVTQMIDATMRLPQYQSNIQKKIESLRARPDGPLDRTIRMFTSFGEGLEKSGDAPKPGEATTKPVGPQSAQPSLTPLSILRRALGTAVSPLATAGIVLILVIFMLLEREELRDRLIRAIGTAPGQLSTTTEAMDEAAGRVSRYLLMQLIVNVTYGIPIGIGLYIIGVPNALMWGMLATVLRFIPFLGPWIAAAFPTALAFAVDPGWSMLIWTLLLFAVVEIISNNFVETWLYGASMGISAVAILLSALFWAWLWGPIGLLMSMPLTVCLMVIGRYIPAFHSLSLMLGDKPGLPLYGRMYQRFLAMDPDEPDRIAQEYLAEHTVEEFFGEVLVPTLRLLEEERYQKSVEPERRAFILEHIRELIADVADHPDPAPAAKPVDSPPTTPEAATTTALPAADPATAPSARSEPTQATPAVVACIPAHDESDEIVALMISILLRRRGVSATTISADLLASERIERLGAAGAPIVCISVLPPYAAVHARHTVQRIHARFPKLTLLVGFWEPSDASTDLSRQLTAVGAIEMVSSVAQAMKSLFALVAAAPAQPKIAPEKPGSGSTTNPPEPTPSA